MFDIGFWELALVGVVALLVIGPERLPGVARTAGLWVGKGRRFVASVKGEIDRELKAEELRRIMAEQAKSSGLYEIGEQAREGLSQTDRALRSAADVGKRPTASGALEKRPAADGRSVAGSGDEPKQDA